jgi:hypothetical protein
MMTTTTTIDTTATARQKKRKQSAENKLRLILGPSNNDGSIDFPCKGRQILHKECLLLLGWVMMLDLVVGW